MKKKKTFKEVIDQHFGSVEKCAAKMGVTTQTIYNYTKVPNTMQIGFFVKLAKELKLTKDELFKLVTR